jgi:hypothetical protein
MLQYTEYTKYTYMFACTSTGSRVLSLSLAVHCLVALLLFPSSVAVVCRLCAGCLLHER